MHYLLALFGSVVYNFLVFVRAKDNCDKATPPVDFDYKKYFKLNWDNWGATLLLAPVVVWFLPAVAAAGNKWLLDIVGFSLSEQAYYLSAGPLTEVLIVGVGRIIGWKESFVAPVHKD